MKQESWTEGIKCKENIVLSPDVAATLKIATLASERVLKYFNQMLMVDYKEDMFDPVTIADKESDALIREMLHEKFPNDLILSEENEKVPDNYEGRVWMVDPLNGTKSFLQGRDSFAVVIALVEDGVPSLGCVMLPVQKASYCAEKGKGAFYIKDGQAGRIHTSNIQEISEARLITREPSGDVRPIEEKLDTLPVKERIPEGSGAKLCAVAAGEAESHINTNARACKWDVAAQQIILEEAGGIVTDLDGKPINYSDGKIKLERSFVGSANKELHDKIIKELKELDV